MREVVDEILKAEKEARDVVSQAREKAEKIRADAEEEYNAKMASGRAEAQKLIRDRLAAARLEMESREAELARRAEGERERYRTRHHTQIERLAASIVSRLVVPEHGARVSDERRGRSGRGPALDSVAAGERVRIRARPGAPSPAVIVRLRLGLRIAVQVPIGVAVRASVHLAGPVRDVADVGRASVVAASDRREAHDGHEHEHSPCTALHDSLLSRTRCVSTPRIPGS